MADASQNEAKITTTVDLEIRVGLALIEQRSEHAVALEEQKRQLRRERDSALQEQKQQSDEERDNALQTQEQQLRIEHDNALQKQKAQLEQLQKDLQRYEEVAESAIRREVESGDARMQELLDRLTKASKYFGFELPEDIVALKGELTPSRASRAVLEELRYRLDIPTVHRPLTEEIILQGQSHKIRSLLTSQVDRIVQACDDRVDTEQCRTTNVQRASLMSEMKVSRTITDLGEQITANDKLWAEVVSRSQACLAAKDQHIDALTERLRLQTQVLDERHVLLQQLADAAAALVG
ncbi:hypothetical protein J4E89_009060 [Alternaria sp. Ai002NY15]|nr:hypothetical protein J4E89_009060 [Alternaria sp. Ai002NY15]